MDPRSEVRNVVEYFADEYLHTGVQITYYPCSRELLVASAITETKISLMQTFPGIAEDDVHVEVNMNSRVPEELYINAQLLCPELLEFTDQLTVELRGISFRIPQTCATCQVVDGRVLLYFNERVLDVGPTFSRYIAIHEMVHLIEDTRVDSLVDRRMKDYWNEYADRVE